MECHVEPFASKIAARALIQRVKMELASLAPRTVYVVVLKDFSTTHTAGTNNILPYCLDEMLLTLPGQRGPQMELR